MSESSEPAPPRLRRRHWLAAGGAIGAAAAAVAALPMIRDAAPVPTGQQPASEKRSGYEATQHVLRYYQTTRI
ncbi:formate dehydrogenase [Variovorax sp. RA8]|uniref:formate dehydrogenase n=1 Tax=Variovorax sp. (strain JCM 16519 / RA8) TaxID=662548 RepID=UPI0013178A4E|nr:formate dehydrogenase [Variovorax sp. RA8]VTU44862.1 formate dehydrogenase region TAT target [Variovorax sp. RA8]